MTEIWYKTFNPEYFVNINGEVRTFDRCEYMPYKNEIRKVTRNGKILKPIKMSNGYFCVDFSSFGKVKRILVHRLICQTFFDEKIKSKHIHHKDGNKENNKLSNLEIVDPKIHCSEHNFKRQFENKTGYRGVHKESKSTYRGSIQRSGKKTIYTRSYKNPKDAYEEIQTILRTINSNNV